jgi:uncharacterized protein YjbI with pentapeptide repeats
MIPFAFAADMESAQRSGPADARISVEFPRQRNPKNYGYFPNPKDVKLTELKNKDGVVLFKSDQALDVPDLLTQAAKAKADLRGVDLRGVYIDKKLRPDAQHIKTYLQKVKFSGLNFAGADFSDSALLDLEFDKCDFSGAKFERVQLGPTLRFSECNLDGASFRGCCVGITSGEPTLYLERCKATCGDFSKSLIYCGLFDSSDLTGAKFDSTIFDLSAFVNGDLTRANFHNADLSRVNFAACKLFGAEFDGDDAKFISAHGRSGVMAKGDPYEQMPLPTQFDQAEGYTDAQCIHACQIEMPRHFYIVKADGRRSIISWQRNSRDQVGDSVDWPTWYLLFHKRLVQSYVPLVSGVLTAQISLRPDGTASVVDYFDFASRWKAVDGNREYPKTVDEDLALSKKAIEDALKRFRWDAIAHPVLGTDVKELELEVRFHASYMPKDVKSK